MATKEEVAAFIASAFPHSRLVIEAVGDRGSKVSLEVDSRDLRPGGTVSGPALMGVADRFRRRAPGHDSLEMPDRLPDPAAG